MTLDSKPPGIGRRQTLAWLLAITIALPCSAAVGGERPHVPGRIFLKVRESESAAKADPALGAILGDGLAAGRPLLRRAHAGSIAGGLDRLLVLQLPESTDIPLLAAKLGRLPNVEYAEPAYEYEIVDDGGHAALAAIPNDPAYTGGQQAYLANLQVEAAWDVFKAENGTPRPIVCIVDGGTNWEHEDLGANIWVNPGEIPANSIDDDGNGFVDDIRGWNFRDNSNNPRGSPLTPSNANHGTHTGGLAAAVTNNAIGAASASWNPILMPINASGSSDRSIAYGYDGIVYAAENGADIVSLSWGGSGGSFALQDVIDFATASGTLVIGGGRQRQHQQALLSGGLRWRARGRERPEYRRALQRPEWFELRRLARCRGPRRRPLQHLRHGSDERLRALDRNVDVVSGGGRGRGPGRGPASRLDAARSRRASAHLVRQHQWSESRLRRSPGTRARQCAARRDRFGSGDPRHQLDLRRCERQRSN